MSEPLSIYRDSLETFLITVTNPDGTPYDLTGKNLIFGVAPNAGDPETFQKTSNPANGIVIGSPASAGLAYVTIQPADTASIPDTGTVVYAWDICLTTGERLQAGAITISPNVVTI